MKRKRAPGNSARASACARARVVSASQTSLRARNNTSPSPATAPATPRAGTSMRDAVEEHEACGDASSSSSDGATDGEEDAEREQRRRVQDRSARKKSARRVVERVVRGASDESSGDELADRVHRTSDDDGEDDQDEDSAADGEEAQLGLVPAEPETPVKKRPRGRPPKDRSRPESPPAADLPPHERYFWDNRTGAGKTSNNVFAPGQLLDHDRFFEQRDRWRETHEAERASLLALHESAFEQWAFELENGFNLCLYGYGSKRELVRAFAAYVHDETSAAQPKPAIVIVNGYAPNLSVLDVLTTLASTLFPATLKLPSTSAALLPLLLDTLSHASHKTYLLLNSLDAPSLRKPSTQSTIAALAAHPNLHLLATLDSPHAPLLWDAPQRARLRLLAHDCTTFAALDAELAADGAVDAVAALLGRTRSRVGGREGVVYVLRSLPENARHLFRILVAELVAAGIEAHEPLPLLPSATDEDGARMGTTATAAAAAAAGGGVAGAAGIEYRVLYHKAREELVCSTEHQLRTLLKEFYDHQMVESRRDALGTERLLVPFAQDELESLLEDLVD